MLRNDNGDILRMTVTSNDGKVKFADQYSPFSITADNINSILYMLLHLQRCGEVLEGTVC